MRRRFRLVLAIVLVAAAGAAVALVAFRVPLAETLLTEALSVHGVPAPRLSVAEIGWHSSRIADIRLGDGDEVSLRELRLGYGLAGLLAGRLDRVTVTGLTVALDLTGAGPPLGSLQALLAGGNRSTGPGGAGSVPLPDLDFADLRLVMRTARGTVQARGDGKAAVDGDGTSAELSLKELSLDGRPLAAGRVSLRMAPDRLDTSLTVDTPAEDFSVNGTAAFEEPQAGVRWRLDLAVRAAAGAAIWAAWPGPVPTAGSAELTVHGEGEAPPLAELTASADPVKLLLARAATGSVSLSAAGVTMPEAVSGLAVAAHATLDTRDGTGTVTLQDPGTLSAASVAPAWLRALGLPEAMAEAAAQGVSARLEPAGPGRPLARIGRDGDATAVALDGTVHLAVPHVLEASLSLPADMRAAPGHLSGRLRAPADLRLMTLRDDRFGALLAPVAIAIPELTVDVAGTSAGATAVDYKVTVQGAPARIRLNRPGATVLEATIDPGRIAATPARIDIADAAFDVPAYAIGVQGLAAGIDLAESVMHADLHVAALRATGANSLFAPLSLAGVVDGKENQWHGTVTGDGPGGVGHIQIAGRFDAATGKGSAHVAMPPLQFSPGGAQPGALVPALTALQQVTGSADGEGDLTWSAGGVRGSASVGLHGLGFDSAQAHVEGLDLSLRLDSLVPPGSPPRQTLTVQRIEAGLPLDRLAIAFQIQPAEPPRLAIETGEVFFGSGRLAVKGLRLDPAAAQQQADVQVENLSLSELFAILGVDGLSGEGRLSGAIPIRFAGTAVTIENGHLAAGAPGVIRYRSQQAAQALAGQGESLDLVLRALEDFHYDELTVDLSKTASDVGRIKLSLLGKNPAVLEGYPFRFNISIEANTGKLISALTTIYQVPTDLLRRAWTSRR